MQFRGLVELALDYTAQIDYPGENQTPGSGGWPNETLIWGITDTAGRATFDRNRTSTERLGHGSGRGR